MKSILISIQPKWVAKILNGEKTIEVRKTCPKQLRGDTPIKPEPIDVYIYCTKDKKYGICWNGCDDICGKVVAKFTLNRVEEIEVGTKENIEQKDYSTFYSSINEMKLFKASCLDAYEILKYAGYCDDFSRAYKYKIYAWHIDNLVIFDKPKPLWHFHRVGGSTLYQKTCKKALEGRCNVYPCQKAEITKAPQSFCYVEYVE